jgi:hypothetical protein
MIARQRIVLPDLEDEYSQIASNQRLTDYYIKLAKELDLSEPKHPYAVSNIKNKMRFYF